MTAPAGEEFDFKGRFTSTSAEEYIADNFRNFGKGDVIWKIESKTGIDLKPINNSESEILFKPHTKYKIIEIKPSSNPKTPNVLIYKIKEL